MCGSHFLVASLHPLLNPDPSHFWGDTCSNIFQYFPNHHVWYPSWILGVYNRLLFVWLMFWKYYIFFCFFGCFKLMLGWRLRVCVFTLADLSHWMFNLLLGITWSRFKVYKKRSSHYCLKKTATDYAARSPNFETHPTLKRTWSNFVEELFFVYHTLFPHINQQMFIHFRSSGIANSRGCVLFDLCKLHWDCWCLPCGPVWRFRSLFWVASLVSSSVRSAKKLGDSIVHRENAGGPLGMGAP